MSLALTGATVVVAFSAVDLMVTPPDRPQPSGGTLAIGASPGTRAAAAAGIAAPGMAGRAAGQAGASAAAGAGAGAGSPSRPGLMLVDGTGRPGALAGVRKLLPAGLAAPEVISGLPNWGRCAHTFLGAAPTARSAATTLAHEVAALRRVPVVPLPASLPKPLTAGPVLVVCEDFLP